MKTNIEYFNYSLINKEQIYDKKYFINEIILTDAENELIKNNRELQNIINEYANQREIYFSKNKRMSEEEKEIYIEKIIKLLKKDNMNLTNFAQSFAVFDASFSLFNNMNKHEKYNFIDFILDNYIETRMELYKEIGDGYLQILYDSHAHKRIGAYGARKTAGQLNDKGYTRINHINLSENQYFLPDNVKKEKFKEFLKTHGIECPWSKNKQNKMPDAVFLCNGTIYIVEHKHLKEGGGGQDKQMTELVDLIKTSQNKVVYISYLDGPYFNCLINPTPSTKLFNIKQDIIKFLEENNNNYFVNTSGFDLLIKDLKNK